MSLNRELFYVLKLGTIHTLLNIHNIVIFKLRWCKYDAAV